MNKILQHWPRLLLAALASVLLVGPAVAIMTTSIEQDVNRPGGDFFSYRDDGWQGLPGCRGACGARQQCVAYTWVRAQGNQPGVCWLKNVVPGPVSNGCCVSGLRTPYEDNKVGIGEQEAGYNRYGGDYYSFDQATTSSSECRAACERDVGKCKAWTMVIPTVPGQRAKCWLKSVEPPAAPHSCCISGVSRVGK